MIMSRPTPKERLERVKSDSTELDRVRLISCSNHCDNRPDALLAKQLDVGCHFVDDVRGHQQTIRWVCARLHGPGRDRIAHQCLHMLDRSAPGLALVG